MLKFNYNLFRGGKDLAQEHAAAWALEESKEGLSQVRRQVEQSMRISWNAYTNARAQLQYRKEHAEAIQKTRDAYHDQFSIGQRTLLDLLDSENELFSANTAYIAAQYVELLGKYRVLGSMGQLMKYFKIPVPDTAKYTSRKWVDGF
jgi:adhesin transport system outer membrane protein